MFTALAAVYPVLSSSYAHTSLVLVVNIHFPSSRQNDSRYDLTAALTPLQGMVVICREVSVDNHQDLRTQSRDAQIGLSKRGVGWTS